MIEKLSLLPREKAGQSNVDVGGRRRTAMLTIKTGGSVDIGKSIDDERGIVQPRPFGPRFPMGLSEETLLASALERDVLLTSSLQDPRARLRAIDDGSVLRIVLLSRIQRGLEGRIVQLDAVLVRRDDARPPLRVTSAGRFLARGSERRFERVTDRVLLLGQETRGGSRAIRADVLVLRAGFRPLLMIVVFSEEIEGVIYLPRLIRLVLAVQGRSMIHHVLLGLLVDDVRASSAYHRLEILSDVANPLNRVGRDHVNPLANRYHLIVTQGHQNVTLVNAIRHLLLLPGEEELPLQFRRTHVEQVFLFLGCRILYCDTWNACITSEINQIAVLVRCHFATIYVCNDKSALLLITSIKR